MTEPTVDQVSELLFEEARGHGSNRVVRFNGSATLATLRERGIDEGRAISLMREAVAYLPEGAYQRVETERTGLRAGRVSQPSPAVGHQFTVLVD